MLFVIQYTGSTLSATINYKKSANYGTVFIVINRRTASTTRGAHLHGIRPPGHKNDGRDICQNFG